MNLKYCFCFLSMIFSLGLGFFLYVDANRSWNLPPVADKITAPEQVEPVTGLDCYGKYSFILDPDSKVEGIESRRQSWRPLSMHEVTYTSFTEEKLEFHLECHKCYGSSDEFPSCGEVSGGALTVLFGQSEWRLGFHHVGAESVFYADELPPRWVLDWLSRNKLERADQGFLKRFGSLYAAANVGDAAAQDDAAKLVICKLIRSFNDHYVLDSST